MKILIATDGSEFSMEAARKMTSMVKAADVTEIMVLYVVEPIAPTAPFGVSDSYYVEAQNAIRAAGESDVKSMKEVLSEAFKPHDVRIQTKVVNGRPKQAIVEEAAEWKSDLIVAGSHGRGFWGRAFLGSVSSAIVKHAPCSVLVIRKTVED